MYCFGPKKIIPGCQRLNVFDGCWNSAGYHQLQFSTNLDDKNIAMIAASEPLEFIPHGRQALTHHPGSVLRLKKSETQNSPDASLLHKLKNVAISEKSDHSIPLSKSDTINKEWWSVRQICMSKSVHHIQDGKSDIVNPENKDAADVFNSKTESHSDFKIPSKLDTSMHMKMDSDYNNWQQTESTPNNLNKPEIGSSMPNLKTDCCYEEELYVNGKTAVWSRGLISNPESKYQDEESRITLTSYTCESQIKHALFCNFHASVNDRHIFDAYNTLNSDVKPAKHKHDFEKSFYNPIPSICIIDSNCLRAFTESGEDYIASLQFQVKKVWSTKYGILLEKEPIPAYHNSYLHYITNTNMDSCDMSAGSMSNRTSAGSTLRRNSNIFSSDSCNRGTTMLSEADITLPTCFSLSHPLDEMTPVLMKVSAYCIQYYNDGNMQIVFVNDSPSISLTYNSKTGLHSLWKIRKATNEECQSLCSNWNKTDTSFQQSSHLNIGANFTTRNNSTSKLQSTSIHRTPTNWLPGVNSPFTRSGTNNSGSQPKNTKPMAEIFNKLGLTPHTSIGQASNSSMQATNMNPAPPSQPLYPDICFEHLWTENQGMTRSNVSSWSAATKTFLHCDHIGQYYLCYLITGCVQRLYIARLKKTHSLKNNSEQQIIVGAVTSIIAKDAVNIPTLNTMAVIDLSGNIILYSGSSVIGKLHIGGVLAGLINSPYNQIKKFDSSFPRRSSLLPMASRGDMPLDDTLFHQLSPVLFSYGSHPMSMEKNLVYSGPQGLRDPIGNKITLEFDSGVYYRITLPDLASSSLVSKCINAIKHVIPKDIVMQVIAKWYGMRNAPGTKDLCAKLEWSMFVSLILNLLGYDVSKLPLTKQPDIGNTEIVSKKQKTSNDGTQEDWEYLLKSGHHVSFGNSLASMLNLTNKNITADSKMSTSSGLEISSSVHKLTRFRKFSQRKSSDMDTTNQDYSTQDVKNVHFNFNSLLFPYILQILYSLHLVYEELKLNVLLIEELEPLARFLHQLCTDLRLESYLNHYWKDYPGIFQHKNCDNHRQISEVDLKRITQPSYFNMTPPNIFNFLYSLMKGDNVNSTFPYLKDVNVTSKDMVEIVGLISNGVQGLVQVINSRDEMSSCSTPHEMGQSEIFNQSDIEHAVVLTLCQKGYNLKDIQQLPPSINLVILNTLSRSKMNPPENWPYQAYALIMREDLALQAKYLNKQLVNTNEESMKENVFSQHKEYDPEHLSTSPQPNENEKNTGLEYIDTKILRLRFPNDHRVTEMCNLLQSSIPVTIALAQRPEVSDHDFIEEQERHLYALCTRTMALPVGRGMVTLRSVPCVITETLQIPKLCLTGRAPPRNGTIELSHIEVPPHYSAWSLFHNGVAAGLKLVPMGVNKIDSAWIVYNKPKQGTVDMLYEHAGFLMALGLNGHLKDMAFMDMYEYLVKCHEMISVGLLLGIASTYRGTMDISTTKLMGIHVEALLPPTSIELDIPQNIQVAALLGVGLLYQRTAHTHITQVLLSEIGRPPGPEMENSSEREGYSLAAGLGLGLVSLGSWKTAPSYLTATLRHYMLGGNKRPLTGSQKEKYKLPSFQIREGPTVNVDVTAPGATLALGMLYLKSGNTEVAKWLAPPPTHYLLDFVRPDLLLLRVIARGLILWDSIDPSEEWVENYVPETVKPYCFVKPSESNIDYEAMNQVYCNIVAGACFSIGLRYAGSANQDACQTILHYAKKFTILGSKSIGELAGKSTIETCLNLILISAAMVMAGTGDLEIMRHCRQQRARAGPNASSLTYGSQLAVHCALGLLFLGAGRYTLSTSSESVAAMICAFFPKFPTHSNDNRYHLQAFRHLYVLATEPRLIIPRDILSGTLCYANIRIVTLSGEQIKNIKAPCLLPELHLLKEVHIEDNRYWPIVFKRDMNWDQLLNLLQNLTCVDIKQRAGCLSYLEDPHGFQSLLAQMLTTEKNNVWSAKPENIFAFSSDHAILNFTKHYLINPITNLASMKANGKANEQIFKMCSNCYFIGVKNLFDKKNNKTDSDKNCVCDKYSREECEFVQQLTMITYECVIQDTLVILPAWITLLKILKAMQKEPSTYHMWQMKLLFAQIVNHNSKFAHNNDAHEPLISTEFAMSMKQKLARLLDSWELDLSQSLKNYMQNESNISEIITPNADVNKLASFITFYDIPRSILNVVSLADLNMLHLFRESDINIDVSNMQIISRVLNTVTNEEMM